MPRWSGRIRRRRTRPRTSSGASGFTPCSPLSTTRAGRHRRAAGGLLRPGQANANDAADQIAVLDAALAQLPEQTRSRVLVRGDTGSGVKPFLWHVTNLGLQFSVGVNTRHPSKTRSPRTPTGLAKSTGRGRQPPRRCPGRRADPMAARDLRRLATGNAGDRPPGTSPSRRPAAHHRPRRLAPHRIRHQHPSGGRLADLEVRHRLRARAEDRIRGLKDTGLTNLPLQAFAKNQIWLELAQLAAELLTWTQLLAWPDQAARTWEPKRLRLRLLAVAGRLITTGRRRILRFSQRWPWTDLITSGHHRLAALT